MISNKDEENISQVIDKKDDQSTDDGGSMSHVDASIDNERQPLLGNRWPSTTIPVPTNPPETNSEQSSGYLTSLKILNHFALFLGVFLANVDTSFVLATYNSIASHFDSASTGSWILIAYNLGNTAALPVYGALSNTFGSKQSLLAAYIIFTIGCALSASATGLWQIILGRLVAGAGGAGMTTTVAVIITEKVEPSRVAVLRSYINLMAIAGRSSGGPIGGIVTDLIGWRWSFSMQIPVATLCFVLVLTNMVSDRYCSNLQQDKAAAGGRNEAKPNRSFDLLGMITFTVFLTTILLGITAIGHPNYVSERSVIVIASVFLVSGTLFVLIELFYAKTPFVPYKDLKGPPTVQMLIQILLLFAQFSVVSNIGAYFARTEAASNSVAALHLIPVAIGNAVGSLSAGQIIKRTKRYKVLAISGLLASILGFTLMAIRWRGRINGAESLYVFACSLGIGIVNTTQFVALTSAGSKNRTASLISFFFLSQQVGMMLGAATSNVVIQRIFRYRLSFQFNELPGKVEVIKRILEDTRYAFLLPKTIQTIVISSYGVAFSTICIISAAAMAATQIPLALLKEQVIQ